MRKLKSCLLAAASALSIPAAHAADQLNGLEMDVMNANEKPDQATARISLPAQANVRAVQRSGSGLQTANDARANGVDHGQDVAEQARDGHGANGQSTADQAHQNHQPPENAGTAGSNRPGKR
ncbi:MAG: hypothetical protein E6R07_13610 [Nevskiaceae bacterium]|nr:MAG: hypothetical protein E6R07_13610 [Nevskiaceae bacterium]